MVLPLAIGGAMMVGGAALSWNGARKKKKAMRGAQQQQIRTIDEYGAQRQRNMVGDMQEYGGLVAERQGDMRTAIDGYLGADNGAGATAAAQAPGRLSAAVKAARGAGGEAPAATGGQSSGAATQIANREAGRTDAVLQRRGGQAAQQMRQGAVLDQRHAKMSGFALGELVRAAKAGDMAARHRLRDVLQQLAFQQKMGQAQIGMEDAQSVGDGQMFAGALLGAGGSMAGSLYNPRASRPQAGMGLAGATDLGAARSNPYQAQV